MQPAPPGDGLRVAAHLAPAAAAAGAAAGAAAVGIAAANDIVWGPRGCRRGRWGWGWVGEHSGRVQTGLLRAGVGGGCPDALLPLCWTSLASSEHEIPGIPAEYNSTQVASALQSSCPMYTANVRRSHGYSPEKAQCRCLAVSSAHLPDLAPLPLPLPLPPTSPSRCPSPPSPPLPFSRSLKSGQPAAAKAGA